ncbi:acyl-CoA dehydrogenase [Sporosarcina sp. P16b]|uniref:acyl-CoA dehydrogenase family protein n=1 Tax=Sporosarcina sp. P16b TaxID=2048261 RepID=UPI000C162E20|nr:acyl-CoA dehydrogenase family protein [Sporosarcina sp. P16b]PIC70639.1 acyl-CoA dehydrogenase [Sporosarcina sp. P16b]
MKQDNELLLFRKSIQAFAKKYIEDDYWKWEEDGNIPREIWSKLGEEGFLCVDIPEKYGGLGAPYVFSSLIVEELNRLGYASIAINLSVHSNIIAHYILGSGTDEQKNRYLPKMASGEMVGAIAMTEPDAGSDLQGIKTNASLMKDESGYLLNGSKTFVSNGQHCDFVIVVARTNPEVRAAIGTTLFIVDIPAVGLEQGKNLNKIGLLSCDTSEVFFEDVKVSECSILGDLNQGFVTLMNELPRERLTIAIGAIGAIDGALELTIQYVKERKAFGKSISDFQNTRFKIAEMMTEARVNRAFVQECLDLLEKGELDTETASMAKLSCTEAQGKITDSCLQLFGGYGYMREYPIGRAFVDARIQRIYGGTSEIMKEIIGRGIFGK